MPAAGARSSRPAPRVPPPRPAWRRTPPPGSPTHNAGGRSRLSPDGYGSWTVLLKWTASVGRYFCPWVAVGLATNAWLVPEVLSEALDASNGGGGLAHHQTTYCLAGGGAGALLIQQHISRPERLEHQRRIERGVKPAVLITLVCVYRHSPAQIEGPLRLEDRHQLLHRRCDQHQWKVHDHRLTEDIDEAGGGDPMQFRKGRAVESHPRVQPPRLGQ